MTTTIGPLTNVPVPGDPIDADWAQDVSQLAVDVDTYSKTLPLGILARANASGALSVGVPPTAIPGASVTFTATSTRWYRTTAMIGQLVPTASGWITLYIDDGAGNIKRELSLPGIASANCGGMLELIESGLSGSITRRLLASVSAGSGAIPSTASSRPAIVVADEGKV